MDKTFRKQDIPDSYLNEEGLDPKAKTPPGTPSSRQYDHEENPFLAPTGHRWGTWAGKSRNVRRLARHQPYPYPLGPVFLWVTYVSRKGREAVFGIEDCFNAILNGIFHPMTD